MLSDLVAAALEPNEARLISPRILIISEITT